MTSYYVRIDTSTTDPDFFPIGLDNYYRMAIAGITTYSLRQSYPLAS